MEETGPLKRAYDLANIILLGLITRQVFLAYQRLPARVPVHFDLAGNPNSWGGRGGFVALAGFAWGMTILFYVLSRIIPRMSRSPRNLSLPHKKEFLKLAPEKQGIYWAMVREFMAGLMAGLNLLWYQLIRGSLRIALGEAGLLPVKALAPALVVIGLVMLFYFRKMYSLPGKLVRGDD